MCQLRIGDPMDFNDSICCTAKTDTETEALSAIALISKEVDAGFVITANESSNFKESDSTKEGVTYMQKKKNCEGKG